MTTYNDIVDSYGNGCIAFCDIDRKKTSSLLAAYLSHKYPQKYNNGKIIDFLSLSSDKIAAFLIGIYKNGEDKENAYNEFHEHIMETLEENFGDDISDDIDQSHDDFYSKENHDANEADNKIKQIKESEDRGYCIKKVFEEAYHKYAKARLEYFQIINMFRDFEKNELCQKA